MAISIEPLFHDPVNGNFYRKAFLYLTEKYNAQYGVFEPVFIYVTSGIGYLNRLIGMNMAFDIAIETDKLGGKFDEKNSPIIREISENTTIEIDLAKVSAP